MARASVGSETRIEGPAAHPVGATITTVEGERTETYGYDADRLVRIDFETTDRTGIRSVGAMLVTYTESGAVEKLVTRHDNGYEALTYTRPKRRQPSLKKLLSVIEEGLLAAASLAVPPMLACTEGVIAVAIAYSFAGPSLPPLLGLLTASEHAALAAHASEPREALNPVEYKLFDVPELQLALSPAVLAACAAVNAASGREREVVAMLERMASRFHALPWYATLVVFVTDLEGTHDLTAASKALARARAPGVPRSS